MEGGIRGVAAQRELVQESEHDGRAGREAGGGLLKRTNQQQREETRIQRGRREDRDEQVPQPEPAAQGWCDPGRRGHQSAQRTSTGPMVARVRLAFKHPLWTPRRRARYVATRTSSERPTHPTARTPDAARRAMRALIHATGCGIFAMLWVAVPAPAQTIGLRGATEDAIERALLDVPDAEHARALTRDLSRTPHMAGTGADAQSRDYVLRAFASYGLDTSTRTYTVYLPWPRVVRAWVAPASGARYAPLTLSEPSMPGGTGPQVLPFN